MSLISVQIHEGRWHSQNLDVRLMVGTIFSMSGAKYQSAVTKVMWEEIIKLKNSMESELIRSSTSRPCAVLCPARPGAVHVDSLWAHLPEQRKGSKNIVCGGLWQAMELICGWLWTASLDVIMTLESSVPLASPRKMCGSLLTMGTQRVYRG